MNIIFRLVLFFLSLLIIGQISAAPVTHYQYEAEDATHRVSEYSYDVAVNLQNCCLKRYIELQHEDVQEGIFLATISDFLVTKGAGKEIGILRDAAKGKGNFGLGSGSRAEADKLGKAWVGDGYKVASDGKTLVGKDGLRQYRPPSYKGRLGKTQANFEQKFPGQKTKGWQSNGHLDITD